MAAGPGRIDVVRCRTIACRIRADVRTRPSSTKIVEQLHAILTHTNLSDTVAPEDGKVVTQTADSRRRIAPDFAPRTSPPTEVLEAPLAPEARNPDRCL